MSARAAVKHEIAEYVSPVGVTWRCSCGWSTQQSRRQNALARAAKLKAAARKHYKAVEGS